MSEQLRPAPEPWIDTAPADTTAGDGGWLDNVARAVDTVPTLVWVGLSALMLLGTLIALPVLRRRAYKAGSRTAGKDATKDREERRDRALFIAAMVPAFGTLVAVLIGNLRGLIAFGRDDLGWKDGSEFLVPVTLDGVGLAFAFLAFRAVRKRRDPGRAVRIAWGASIASAIINFGHEAKPGGSMLAGGYLALLAIFVMLIFHELLDQFTEGTEWIRREYPAFRLRWLTWPTNTACAWVAWRNYPPAEGTKATVAEAVAHLNAVRATKREERRARDLDDAGMPGPWWILLAPWVRVRQLATALAEHRSVVERLERTAEQYVAAEREAGALAEQLAVAEAERQAAQEAVRVAEQTAEHARSEAAEQVRRLTEQMAALRSEQNGGAGRSSANRSSGSGRGGGRASGPEQKPNAPKLTDDEAVAAMLRAHRSADYEWSPREVHRITGAGFGRIPKLIAMVAEHHARSGGADDDSDDAKEGHRNAEIRTAAG